MRVRPARTALVAVAASAAALCAAARFGAATAAAFVGAATRLSPVASTSRQLLGRAAARSTEAAESEEVAADGRAEGAAGSRRAALGAASLAAAFAGNEQRAVAQEPKITAKCAFDIRLGLSSAIKPRRVVIGLFGEEAPGLTGNFLKACSASIPGEAGQSARYQLSTVRSIAKDRVIAFADFPGGNFLFKRTAPSRGGMVKEEKIPLAGPDTKTEETNELKHDAVGRVSMPKGGGTFNFLISPVANAPFLDKRNVVIGQVLEGLDVIEDINKIQTTPKGGILNLASARSEDPMAPESSDDYLNIPLTKTKIMKSQVLGS